MKKIILAVILFFMANSTYALDVVYPKKTSVVINSSSTFFIGSSNPKVPLMINDSVVDVHPSGGFAYVVQLHEDENNFCIKSGDEIKKFVITKPKATASSYFSPQLTVYENRKYFITTSDSTPLRETPVDSGINRISHFQKDIQLMVDAEQGEFYRVVLNDNKYAWISKAGVKLFDKMELATIKGHQFEETSDFYKYTFWLDKKIPYKVDEGEYMHLTFYNVKDYADNTCVFVMPNQTPRLLGYSAEYEGDNLIFKVRKFPAVDKHHPLKNIVIAVDAGHGGSEFGAVGCLGHKEKDINLMVSKYLKHELERRGADVVMTREEDVNVGLQDRVDIANEKDAAILISLHANALPDGANPNKSQGTSIYYYYNQAKLLAANILCEVTSQTSAKNDNIRQGSLALVRNTSAVSVLVEMAYLINPEDNTMLVNPHFQKKCAKAIADGIEKYLK